jgi:nucleotide-binding universal stress UspA family protein
MYDTILIPVDLSSANTAVFDTARRLGSPGDTDILLLHVVETLQEDEPGEMDDFYEELRAEAEKKMTAWADQIASDGFEVRAEITYGQRAPEITRVAEDEAVDLIVQRSHRVDRDDDPESSVGTVSHQVAIFASCSVFLVRGDDQ